MPNRIAIELDPFGIAIVPMPATEEESALRPEHGNWHSGFPPNVDGPRVPEARMRARHELESVRRFSYLVYEANRWSAFFKQLRKYVPFTLLIWVELNIPVIMCRYASLCCLFSLSFCRIQQAYPGMDTKT